MEKLAESQIVYDIKGHTYNLLETCKNGYIVQEIWQETDWDGEVNDIFGNTLILKEIYKEPQTKKKAKEILELEDKIKALRVELRELRKERQELIKLTDKSTEDIIKDKLKEYPQTELLLSILDKIAKPYRVTSSNFVEEIKDYVAVKGDKLCITDGYGWKIDDYGEVFVSKEDAEKAMLENIIKNTELKYTYTWNRIKELNTLFEKYNIKKPVWWGRRAEDEKKKALDDLTKRYNMAITEKNYYENRIKSLGEEINKMEEE